jgi:hypothetical protein
VEAFLGTQRIDPIQVPDPRSPGVFLVDLTADRVAKLPAATFPGIP